MGSDSISKSLFEVRKKWEYQNKFFLVQWVDECVAKTMVIYREFLLNSQIMKVIF